MIMLAVRLRRKCTILAGVTSLCSALKQLFHLAVNCWHRELGSTHNLNDAGLFARAAAPSDNDLADAGRLYEWSKRSVLVTVL